MAQGRVVRLGQVLVVGQELDLVSFRKGVNEEVNKNHRSRPWRKFQEV